MSSDSINRVPPPTADPLRTTAPTGTPIVKRQHDQNPRQKESEEPDDNTPHDPEDHVELSGTPLITDEDDADSDNPDRFQIALTAVRDLLGQHADHYPPMELARLYDQLAFLEMHNIPTVYWPPHIPLQEAITRACQTVSLPSL